MRWIGPPNSISQAEVPVKSHSQILTRWMFLYLQCRLQPAFYPLLLDSTNSTTEAQHVTLRAALPSINSISRPRCRRFVMTTSCTSLCCHPSGFPSPLPTGHCQQCHTSVSYSWGGRLSLCPRLVPRQKNIICFSIPDTLRLLSGLVAIHQRLQGSWCELIYLFK